MLQELWSNRTVISNHFSTKIRNITHPVSKWKLGAELGWLILILIGLILIYTLIKYLEWDRSSESPSTTPGIETFTAVQTSNKSQLGPGLENQDGHHVQIQNVQIQINYIQPGDHEYSKLQAYIAEKYLIYMNQPNIQARGFDTLAELITKYQRGICQPITQEEQSRTSKWISQEIDRLPNAKFREIASKWISASWLCKAQPWLEGGMPHTHDRMIIMKPEWFQSGSTPSKTDIGILWHEMTHIWQRLAPQDFTDLFTQWGFKEMPIGPEIQVGQELDNDAHSEIQIGETPGATWPQNPSPIPQGLDAIIVRSRLNPDALPNTQSVWFPPATKPLSGYLSQDKTGYLIGAVYPTVNPHSLHDIEFRAYPLVANGTIYLGQQSIELTGFKPFADFFGSGRNHYHPNELAAHYMDELLTGRLDTKYPGCQIFADWIAKQ